MSFQEDRVAHEGILATSPVTMPRRVDRHAGLGGARTRKMVARSTWWSVASARARRGRLWFDGNPYGLVQKCVQKDRRELTEVVCCQRVPAMAVCLMFQCQERTRVSLLVDWLDAGAGQEGQAWVRRVTPGGRGGAALAWVPW